MTAAASHDWTMESYARLTRDLAIVKAGSSTVDIDLRARVESLLYREARLLDDGDFDQWLSLMTTDCLYWVPSTPDGGDPTTEVSLAFDDHRRLSDRVYWLHTGLVFAQIPASRTRRIISNVEAWRGDEAGVIYARSNFLIHEFRAGRQRLLSGWYAHVLTHGHTDSLDDIRIRTKISFLTDSDQGHDNLTLVF